MICRETNRERVRKSRAKKIEAGYHHIGIWIPRKTQKQIEILENKYPPHIRLDGVICRAIECFYLNEKEDS